MAQASDWIFAPVGLAFGAGVELIWLRPNGYPAWADDRQGKPRRAERAHRLTYFGVEVWRWRGVDGRGSEPAEEARDPSERTVRPGGLNSSGSA